LAVLVPLVFLYFNIYGSYLWTFPLVVVWHFGIRRAPVHELGLTRSRLGTSIVVGVLSGVALGTACGFIIQSMSLGGVPHDDPTIGGHSFAPSTGFYLAVRSDTLFLLIIYFLYYIVFVGLGEELVWRGTVQQEITKRSNKHAAILITGLTFGVIHIFLLIVLPVWQGIVMMALIAIGGVIWGYLFDTLKSIWAIAISHGITSAIIWKYFFFV
jgi:membrane protease YdiL (CAAX protease family)